MMLHSVVAELLRVLRKRRLRSQWVNPRAPRHLIAPREPDAVVGCLHAQVLDVSLLQRFRIL